MRRCGAPEHAFGEGRPAAGRAGWGISWESIKVAFVRQLRAGGKGDDPVARVTGALGGVDDQLGAIRTAIEKAMNGGRADPLEELGPRFDQLAASLGALGRPQLEIKLDSGVSGAQIELLRAQSSLLERAMQHLAQQAERASKVAEVVATNPAPALARTPAGPDPRMDQLVTMMTELEGRVRRAMAPALSFDVQLGDESPSNFYTGLGGDVVGDGGVFVATYAKLPQLGASVLLNLSLPLGGRCQVEGTVEWTQDRLGDDTPPGFGVRITAADETARGCGAVLDVARAALASLSLLAPARTRARCSSRAGSRAPLALSSLALESRSAATAR